MGFFLQTVGRVKKGRKKKVKPILNYSCTIEQCIIFMSLKELDEPSHPILSGYTFLYA